MRKQLIAAAVGVLALGGVAAGLALAKPQPQRMILRKMDLSGEAKEAQLGFSDLPSGTVVGRHHHAGEEIGYVLSGRLELTIDGQPAISLKAGDTYAVPRGAVHTAKATGSDDARMVAIWIIDKGQPLAIPDA